MTMTVTTYQPRPRQAYTITWVGASSHLHMVMMGLLELPDELLLRVLYFLDVPELLAVSRVRP